MSAVRLHPKQVEAIAKADEPFKSKLRTSAEQRQKALEEVHILQGRSADSKSQEGISCSRCLDYGYLVTRNEEGGYYAARACPCRDVESQQTFRREQAKLERTISCARRGKRCSDKTFDDFDVRSGKEEAFYAALDYVCNFKSYRSEGIGLTFIGPCGRGKTLLSSIICNEVIKRGYTALIVVAKALYLEMQSTYSKTTGREPIDVINPAVGADLLVLDNLNAGRFGSDELEKLFLVINGRVEHKRPTMINATKDLDKLNNKLAPDHISRIMGCNGQPIRIGGEDMRRVQSQAITSRREESIRRLKEGV